MVTNNIYEKGITKKAKGRIIFTSTLADSNTFCPAKSMSIFGFVLSAKYFPVFYSFCVPAFRFVEFVDYNVFYCFRAYIGSYKAWSKTCAVFIAVDFLNSSVPCFIF